MPQELDATKGGNVVFNQGPYAMDIVRPIGGGMVRSVRAMTGAWDPARRAEGVWAAYIEFDDGTPAVDVFSGYAHFDTAELTWWMGESGSDADKDHRTRGLIAGLRSPEEEWALKSEKRYGGGGQVVRGHPIAVR